jgi:dTDP-4-amino-4,6-dideoxygalactose transaminase
VLDDLNNIIEKRKEIFLQYDARLDERFKCMEAASLDTVYSYAYYPVLFSDEEELKIATARLKEKDIYPRRYFYPSLNKLPFINKVYNCPVSEDIAIRVACLPLSHYTTEEEVRLICGIINDR